MFQKYQVQRTVIDKLMNYEKSVLFNEITLQVQDPMSKVPELQHFIPSHTLSAKLISLIEIHPKQFKKLWS